MDILSLKVNGILATEKNSYQKLRKLERTIFLLSICVYWISYCIFSSFCFLRDIWKILFSLTGYDQTDVSYFTYGFIFWQISPEKRKTL